ncbi:MAG: hypothetical protein GC168_10600 [Candidatus Hydrogenedens sp.]|nr:hypothetical protein [Candidatus Hydrogenedens sp.]
MEALKRMWNRILVAFAAPAEGHGASGTRGADPHSEPQSSHAAGAERKPQAWHPDGGERR